MTAAPLPEPSIDWLPFEEAKVAGWSEPQDWRFARALEHIPLNDTEMLQVSHFLPIMVHVQGRVVQVVAPLKPTYQDVRLFGAVGQWLPSYTPIALRCMPFALAEQEGEATKIRVATNLFPADGPAAEVAAAAGADSIVKVLRTLDMVGAGQKRLAQAAEMLLLAGICVKLGTSADDIETDGYYTVDATRFRELPNLTIATAARASFLALDLASACLFSSRLLNRRLIRAALQNAPDSAMPSGGRDLDALIRSVAPIPVRLDEDAKLDILEVLSLDK